MQVFRDPTEVHAHADALRSAGSTVGFVPTMGALHEGHLSLVRHARASCDRVVVSIYVNPLQFAPHEDLAAYPRPLDADLAVCEAAGVDDVVVLDDAAVYGPGYATRVAVDALGDHMEGAVRPHFFRGVATIVAKLLIMVRPTDAWFGQKDAQQALIVKRLTLDLGLPTRIHVAPTSRESDGLARASRNAYISPNDRAAAPALYGGLVRARKAYAAGERRVGRLTAAVAEAVLAAPLLALEYAEVADLETATPMPRDATLGESVVLLAAAARIGKTRLLDNVLLPPGASL